jgi:hypothetical protein
MLKKGIFFVIVLLVVGLTVVSAQDMAKLTQLQTELEQIQAKANTRGGSFTPQEVQRMNEIQTEMMQAAGIGGSAFNSRGPSALEQQFMNMEQQALQQGTQQSAQRQRELQQQQEAARVEYIKEHTGENRGWPAESLYTKRFNISALRQPSGTTASYEKDESKNSKTGNITLSGITIYLQNATDNTVQDLKRQVEAATKKTMEGSSNDFSLWISGHIPDGYWGNLSVIIEKLEHGIVRLYIADARPLE